MNVEIRMDMDCRIVDAGPPVGKGGMGVTFVDFARYPIMQRAA